MITVLTAKVIQDGDDQIIVFPEGFRFDCEEVLIEKVGNALILRPVSR